MSGQRRPESIDGVVGTFVFPGLHRSTAEALQWHKEHWVSLDALHETSIGLARTRPERLAMKSASGYLRDHGGAASSPGEGSAASVYSKAALR